MIPVSSNLCYTLKHPLLHLGQDSGKKDVVVVVGVVVLMVESGGSDGGERWL